MTFMHNYLNQYKQYDPQKNVDYYTEIFLQLCDNINLKGDILEVHALTPPTGIISKLIQPSKNKHYIFCNKINNEQDFINNPTFANINTFNSDILSNKITFAYLDIKTNEINKYLNILKSKLVDGGSIFINFPNKCHTMSTHKSLFNLKENEFTTNISPNGISIKKHTTKQTEVFYNIKIQEIKNWAIIKGDWGWGDMMAQLVYTQNIFNEYGIILCSDNPDRFNFLKYQYGVKAIIKSNKIIDEISHDTTKRIKTNKEYINILNKKHLNPDYVIDASLAIQTEQGSSLSSKRRPINIPNDIKSSIKHFVFHNNEKFILIQPYSINSCPQNLHWEHWDELINEIVNTTDCNIILVGKNWDSNNYKNNKKIINIVDKTATPSHMFWLSTYAQYTITTANCLSLWVKYNDLPATIIFTAHSYFKFWNDVLTQNNGGNIKYIPRHEKEIKPILNYLNLFK